MKKWLLRFPVGPEDHVYNLLLSTQGLKFSAVTETSYNSCVNLGINCE